MPNAQFACTIAGIPVDFTYDAGADIPRGSQGAGNYGGKTVVMADAQGSLTGKFNMPNGVPAGSQPVKIFHYTDATLSWAQASFSSFGFRKTTQGTTAGFTTVVERIQSTVEVVQTWGDPLAQSILVTDAMRYLSQVDIFFANQI